MECVCSGRKEGENSESTAAPLQSQRNLEAATEFFERYMHLAKEIGDAQAVSKAKIYIGISRGTATLPRFIDAVCGNLDALIKWRELRIPLP